MGSVHGSGIGVLCGDKEIRIVDSFTVVQGRVMCVDIKKRGFHCRVINIYGHTEPGPRRELLTNLDTCFMTSKKIIVGGDFNCSLEKDERSYILRIFISKYDLVDVMGRLYGNQLDFSWENSRGIKSRLDYILIGTKDEVIDGKVMLVFFSAHSAVSARVVVSGPEYGKGYGKMNNEVLTEYDFRESFMKMFAIWVEMKG